MSTPNKRKFVSPLLHQITSSSKKHKLVCNYSSAEEKQVDGMCGGGEDDSVCTGEEQTSSPTLNEVNSMTQEKKLLQQRLEEKKEKLRKLKLVKMYRVKVLPVLPDVLWNRPFTVSVWYCRITWRIWKSLWTSGGQCLRMLQSNYWQSPPDGLLPP